MREVDSLNRTLDTSFIDTSQVNKLVDIGLIYLEMDYGVAQSYGELVLKYSEELNYKEGLADGYYIKGYAIYFTESATESIENYQKAYELYMELGDSNQAASSISDVGMIYGVVNNIELEIENYHKALALFKATNDTANESTVLNNLGLAFSIIGDHDRAVDFLMESIRLKKLVNDPLSIPHCNLADIYSEWGDTLLSFYYDSLAYEMAQTEDDIWALCVTNEHMGNQYLERGDYDKAQGHYNTAMKLNVNSNDRVGMASTILNLARLHYHRGELDSAEYKALEGLALSQELEAAEEDYLTFDLLSDIYEAKGDFESAFDYQKRYAQLKDSVFDANLVKDIEELETKYQIEQKDILLQAKEAESREHELEAKQRRQLSYFLYVGLILLVIIGVILLNKYRTTNKHNKLIAEKNEEVLKQKEIAENQMREAINLRDQVQEKNKEITDSINYARRIQSAILPSQTSMDEAFENYFVLYKPKDIVAGDFYWMEEKDGKKLFAVADCTGHGVPGAMVSVICNNGLNRSVREHGITAPNEILNRTRNIIIEEFEKSDEDVKDGMDIALCSIEGMKLEYSGANNPLWIIREGVVIELKADKQPIGKFLDPVPYALQEFELIKGDKLYLFSDGYIDQFGGEKGKKFKAKSFKELLISVQGESMTSQLEAIDKCFEAWRGDLEQIDDVCVLGIEI